MIYVLERVTTRMTFKIDFDKCHCVHGLWVACYVSPLSVCVRVFVHVCVYMCVCV